MFFVNCNYKDGFFAGQAYLHQDFVIFGVSLFFIIFPLIVHLYQLHISLDKWRSDIETGQFVSAWIYSHLRKLYLFCIVCGSSFAAITCMWSIYNIW